MSEIVKALVAFHKAVPSITKDAKAQYGKYADLGGVLSTVTPPLNDAGLAIVQTFTPNAIQGADPLLITKLLHESGEEITSELPMIIGKGRNPLHDWGGSCTYQRRYAILSILGLCADMDTDGNFEQPEEKKVSKPAPQTVAKTAAPKAESQPNAETIPPEKKPLTDDEAEELRGLIKELPVANRTAFLDRFRSQYGLAPSAKVAYAITTHEHRKFIQDIMPEFI